MSTSLRRPGKGSSVTEVTPLQRASLFCKCTGHVWGLLPPALRGKLQVGDFYQPLQTSRQKVCYWELYLSRPTDQQDRDRNYVGKLRTMLVVVSGLCETLYCDSQNLTLGLKQWFLQLLRGLGPQAWVQPQRVSFWRLSEFERDILPKVRPHPVTWGWRPSISHQLGPLCHAVPNPAFYSVTFLESVSWGTKHASKTQEKKEDNRLPLLQNKLCLNQKDFSKLVKLHEKGLLLGFGSKVFRVTDRIHLLVNIHCTNSFPVDIMKQKKSI